MGKKAFWKSKSFWGVVIMAVGIYSPRIASELSGSVDDVITLIGLVTTLWGRWHATQALTVTATPPAEQ